MHFLFLCLLLLLPLTVPDQCKVLKCTDRETCNLTLLHFARVSETGKEICYLDCIKRSLAAFKIGTRLASVGIQGYIFRNQFQFVFTSYLSVSIGPEGRLPLISPFFSSSRQECICAHSEKSTDGSREACIRESVHSLMA